MTRTEKKGLYDLRNDENIVIKPSDKSKGFVVMSRESYMEKATAMLDCQINYERSEIKIEEIERCTRLTVGKLTENKLPVALANALLPANCRISRFYGLPKDHKPGLPLRPVVYISSCGRNTIHFFAAISSFSSIHHGRLVHLQGLDESSNLIGAHRISRDVHMVN